MDKLHFSFFGIPLLHPQSKPPAFAAHEPRERHVAYRSTAMKKGYTLRLKRKAKKEGKEALCVLRRDGGPELLQKSNAKTWLACRCKLHVVRGPLGSFREVYHPNGHGWDHPYGDVV